MSPKLWRGEGLELGYNISSQKNNVRNLDLQIQNFAIASHFRSKKNSFSFENTITNIFKFQLQQHIPPPYTVQCTLAPI